MISWWWACCSLVVTIRRAGLDDADGISSMLVQSVTSLGQPYYKNDQIEAWVDLLPPSTRIREMLGEGDRLSWVATVIPDSNKDDLAMDASETVIAGYIDWKPGQNEIDFLYVHPMFARQGVAGLLYQKVLQEAQKQPSASNSGILIQTFASEGAKPFFEKQNFRLVERRDFSIGNNKKKIVIHNYKMELRREDFFS